RPRSRRCSSSPSSSSTTTRGPPPWPWSCSAPPSCCSWPSTGSSPGARAPCRPEGIVRGNLTEPRAVRVGLTAIALLYLLLFLLVPLGVVFAEALQKGWAAYLAAVTEP